MGHPIDTSKYTYWTRLLPAIQACYKDTVDFKKAAELLNEDYSKSAGGSVPEKTSSYSVKAPRNSWSGSAIEIRYMVLDNLLQPELVRIEVFCPTWRSNPDFSTQHMLSPALDAFPEDHTYFRRGPKNENGHYNVTIMTPIRKRKGEKVKKEIWASSKDFMLFFELPLSYDAANKKLKVPNLKNLVLDLEFFPHSEITDRVNWILGAFPDLKCLYLYAGEKWFGAMSAHNLLKSGLPLDMVLAAAKGEHFDRFEKVKNGLLAAKKTDIELKFVAFELPIPEIQKIMDGAAAA